MLENLGAVERRVYAAYWDDGLLDMFAAVGVLAIGLFWLRDWAAAAVIVPAWLVPLWKPVRVRFIEPRLGAVQFTKERERRNTRRLKLTIYFGIACLVLGLELYFLRDRLSISPSVSMIAGLPALLLAVMSVIAAILVSSGRFLVYSAVLVVVAVVGALNDWHPGLILATAGACNLAIAVVVLTGFLRENPSGLEAPND